MRRASAVSNWGSSTPARRRGRRSECSPSPVRLKRHRAVTEGVLAGAGAEVHLVVPEGVRTQRTAVRVALISRSAIRFTQVSVLALLWNFSVELDPKGGPGRS